MICNMTSDSVPQSSPAIHEQNDSTAECGVSLTADEVHTVFEQPVDAADEERHNFCPMQCLQRVARPTTIDCEMSGGSCASRTKFILQRAMWEKLPVLLDIYNSTSGEQLTTAQNQLPFSVKGFVSLLLVLEGHVKLRQWFRGDIDTYLPTQTLLVCINGCKCTGVANPVYSEGGIAPASLGLPVYN
jgi:hypothetical protein